MKMGRVITLISMASIAVLLTVGTATGASLTAANITDDQFTAIFSTVVLAPGEFSFTIDGNSGSVTSVAWSGTVDSQTVYAYTYQFEISVGEVGGISLSVVPGSIATNLVDFDGGGNDEAFIISGGSPLNATLAAEFDVFGDLGPDSISTGGSDDRFRSLFTSGLGPDSGQGDDSFIWGFVSLLSPTTTTPNIIDGTVEGATTVVTTAPEPTTVLLLGSGLLGLMGIGYRRRRRLV